ncbi:MAG: PIN domain-containing protein [Myxococcales bacterium]|nr:PIN domain-containing protein [Myxococcales bacterium]
MILLDTNALLWLELGHARSRPLARWAGRLYLSPATLLELQLLQEVGRLRFRGGFPGGLADDDRWLLDSPPADRWFTEALALSWTRDPFDRLLVAHARLRGFRLATGDGELFERLEPTSLLEL